MVGGVASDAKAHHLSQKTAYNFWLGELPAAALSLFEDDYEG